MNTQLTIVIPCKNEGRNVIETLKCIYASHIDCLIVIADSSDEEGSRLLLKKYQLQSSMPIRIVTGGLPSFARNNGAKWVKTPYILFLDADVFIKDPKLINHCLHVAINGDYDLLTPQFKTTTGEYNWIFKIFNVVQRIISIKTPFAIGGFMFFKTETFRALGGFDEQAKVAEDYLLSSKVKPNRFKIINEPVYTTPRRFKNKGVMYMVKLMIGSWWNKNNPEWFKHDHDYWK
jgi:glycosyltransferase involved in cell wall biosynthesis